MPARGATIRAAGRQCAGKGEQTGLNRIKVTNSRTEESLATGLRRRPIPDFSVELATRIEVSQEASLHRKSDLFLNPIRPLLCQNYSRSDWNLIFFFFSFK